MTHCGDGMHGGLNSSVSLLRLQAYGKAQSCVCVCGLISRAPWDSLAALESVEINSKSSEIFQHDF